MKLKQLNVKAASQEPIKMRLKQPHVRSAHQEAIVLNQG